MLKHQFVLRLVTYILNNLDINIPNAQCSQPRSRLDTARFVSYTNTTITIKLYLTITSIRCPNYTLQFALKSPKFCGGQASTSIPQSTSNQQTLLVESSNHQGSD